MDGASSSIRAPSIGLVEKVYSQRKRTHDNEICSKRQQPGFRERMISLGRDVENDSQREEGEMFDQFGHRTVLASL